MFIDLQITLPEIPQTRLTKIPSQLKNKPPPNSTIETLPPQTTWTETPPKFPTKPNPPTIHNHPHFYDN
jgi:hypothetical protein